MSTTQELTRALQAGDPAAIAAALATDVTFHTPILTDDLHGRELTLRFLGLAEETIVLLAGPAEIVEGYGSPGRVIINSYGPGEFLGEVGLLTSQRALLTAVVKDPGRVLRVPSDRAHVVMAQEADLSELILRAFLARHARLTQHGSGPTLVGSRFDPSTRRLLGVLARNRLSSRWLELENSDQAESALRELDVPPTDLPIVLVPGGPLLRNPTDSELLGALGLSVPPEERLQRICDACGGFALESVCRR